MKPDPQDTLDSQPVPAPRSVSRSQPDTKSQPVIQRKKVLVLSLASVVLLLLSGPPWKIWPLSLVAVVPWLLLVTTPGRLDRRGYLMIWLASTAYWLMSLQGLRHAHPAIYVAWVALAMYLAVYHVLFVGWTRRLVRRGFALCIAAPLVWITTELIRNYLLSGISVLMLGHAVADVPVLIQIADLAGTYGVSLVLVAVNVAAFALLGLLQNRRARAIRQRVASAVACVAVAGVLLLGTLGYGAYRLGQQTGDPLARFLLLQRNEPVDYLQSQRRELEIFEAYAQQSIAAVNRSQQPIDAVVWPESMFSGGAAWMIAGDDLVVPEQATEPGGARLTDQQFRQLIRQQQDYVQQRAARIGQLMTTAEHQLRPPGLIAGCGVVRYGQLPAGYSGVVHVDPGGTVQSWYGKMHLVMFGEYIPLLAWIPGAASLMPPGMGLATGTPRRMHVAGTVVSPSVCIETAVERVTAQQIAAANLKTPDVVVTVTNDGWFDDSSLVAHHLRCIQLVAAGVRKPVLSAANNGPTAWVDDRGRIVKRLPRGVTGEIVATPTRATTASLYLTLGDWPVRTLGLATLVMSFAAGRGRNSIGESEALGAAS